MIGGRAASGSQRIIKKVRQKKSWVDSGFLDDDGAAASAIDAPHGLQEEDKESPQGMNSKRRSPSWS